MFEFIGITVIIFAVFIALGRVLHAIAPAAVDRHRRRRTPTIRDEGFEGMNVDGTPMHDGVDMNGNVFGITSAGHGINASSAGPFSD